MTESSKTAPLLGIPASTLTALRRGLAEDRDAGATALLLRRVGYQSGEGFYHALQEWLREREGSLDQLPAGVFWDSLDGFFEQAGWGGLRYERLHDAVGSLSSSDWAEAEPAEATAHPACHFSTGMLADLLGRVAGDDLAVLEVECRSRGDERCRFLMGGADALGRLYERLRQGDSVDAALDHIG